MFFIKNRYGISVSAGVNVEKFTKYVEVITILGDITREFDITVLVCNHVIDDSSERNVSGMTYWQRGKTFRKEEILMTRAHCGDVVIVTMSGSSVGTLLVCSNYVDLH